MAKVTALYDVKVNDWERRRDFFTASVVAGQLNAKRGKDTDRYFQPEEILYQKYPRDPKDVVITEHDPDRGAQGDWRGLKQNLKGTTAKQQAKRAKRPRPVK